ncbi:heparinase II/III family protein [Hirschia baltica]|uniref:Heparinase II/III family protein n=1 Tax=Hirschia baltica (strain ATCC 49814 / DSM 5838 / IFAM 1418) TaxID=582402 RepID=C6XRR9_HIRBI|nr:heparinase II/III family protein [Hirschia baltica]ACT60679.1 Heparinase II/III family protein [Hirschia baltica ATCC 49814]
MSPENEQSEDPQTHDALSSETTAEDSNPDQLESEQVSEHTTDSTETPKPRAIPSQYADMKDAAEWTEFTGEDGLPIKSSPMYRMRLNPATFNALLGSPKTGHPARAKRGENIINGQWRFGTEKLEVPEARAPWGPPFPSVNFADRIHRFHWLRDLLANGEAGEKLARSLTVSWAKAFGKWDDTAWRVNVTADRVINWLSAAPVVIAPVSSETRANLLDCLARQARHLSLSYENVHSLRGRFRCALALTLAGICLPESESYLELGLENLEKEIGLQLLKDGGHVTRSPSRLAETLIDLNIVEDFLLRMGKEAPAFLSKAQMRMQNMLKFLQLGDGGLLVANSSSDGWDGLATTALAPFGEGGGKFAFAQQTGFQRIQAGDLTLYMDTGSSQTGENTEIASASCLSIHVCDGPHRIITSMGAYSDLDPAWKFAARQTAASSTLVLDNQNSGIFKQNETTGLMELLGPPNVSARRLEEGDQFLLEGQHSGWRQSHGLVHRRRLFLAKNGTRITGEDSVYRPLAEISTPPEEDVPCALRFQLHPQISVEQGEDTHSVFLLIGDTGITWKLRAEQTVHVEKTVYTAGGVRLPAAQLVVYCKVNPIGDGTTAPNRLRWALSRTSSD